MKRSMFLAATFFVVAFGLVSAKLACADVDEGMLSISAQTLAGESGWGGDVAIPLNYKTMIGHITSSAQGGDGIIKGNLHAEIGRSFNGWDVVLFNDTLGLGYGWGVMGYDTAFGISGEAPEQDVGNFHITGGFGIFGRGGGPWATPTAWDVLEQNNFAPNTLDQFPGLREITPARTALSIKGDSSVNLRIYTEIKEKRTGATLTFAGLPEIGGAGDNPVHKGLLKFKISKQLTESFGITAAVDITAQTWEGDIQWEKGTRFSGDYYF